MANLNGICSKVFPHWQWTSNSNLCQSGTRIILRGTPDIVNLMVMSMSDQALHCMVKSLSNDVQFHVSFIDAHNYYITRRALWRELEMHKCLLGNHPWVMLGDFNASLSVNDSSCGSSSMTIAMSEFKDCVERICMSDVNHMGLHFTWNQRPKASSGLLKKIDRVMANDEFISTFVNAYAVFHPYRISDHSPAILKIPTQGTNHPKPFKFANFITFHDEFRDTVSDGWKTKVQGYKMFQVVKKLRALKKPLRKLAWRKGNLHDRVVRLRNALDEAQTKLDKWLDSISICEEESCILKEYNEACLEEELFLKQKAKVDWLREGDFNTRYFHNVVKGRRHRNRIQAIMDDAGLIREGNEVPDLFVKHYETFIGSASPVDTINRPEELFVKTIPTDKAEFMVREVSMQEVKDVVFECALNKSPGPDGFTAEFFRAAWDIIGEDITSAVRGFFHTGKLLKELNHTIISLLPKVTTPNRVTDYRPISCCNVLYKFISKIITNRIKGCLDDIVSSNQSAFNPGRRITDNILLTQDLMKNYHLSYGPPRCAFKIDIQKAYDTVDWNFLENILVRFGFPKVMVDWIMVCVESASFSICINGELHGYFRGKRGLRQGDPLSPLLFTLVMEALTLMLNRRATELEDFRFHPNCGKLNIINLCFADDLFIFSYANPGSVTVIAEALDEFKRCSGLVPSLAKSTTFFANVSNVVKAAILEILPFDEGMLPVKYLGVPLVSSSLFHRDCKILVDRVRDRISDWKNKFLSYAGRVQLITSVLTTMQLYWQSAFIVPIAIIKEIEGLIRGFIWCQGEMKRGKAKVKWSRICLPKQEGGLGIKRLKEWNVALMASHIWRVLTNKKSLWVQWVHTYRLKGRSFWDAPVVAGASVSWRKILSIRDYIRDRFVYNVGDGATVSAWHDAWSDYGPLANFISNRDILNAGYSREAKICDIVSQDGWNLPNEWYSKYPGLHNINPPVLSNVPDSIRWRDYAGNLVHFSVGIVWNTIRTRSDPVNWFPIVWFPQCIPRHSFLVWLLFGENLKTQDKLKPWEIGASVVLLCPFCHAEPDSHLHLFFRCPFAAQVWKYVKSSVRVNVAGNDWTDFVDSISSCAARRTVCSIVSKLLFGAAVYMIWQERNKRLFKKDARSYSKVVAAIFSMVRLKIMALKWKNSMQVKLMKDAWKVP
ncbi:uncharacterized protein [Rutidosis leptorrhynchoides]|uniref:uncharacterized protein n=1 Tax=Rutidosis leptorrhynchoides TaxID=125765 RepID=UPI003A996E1E